MTNYEKIKQMTPEEIAEFMDSVNRDGCLYCAKDNGHCPINYWTCKPDFLAWLNQEVEE